MIKAIIFDCFDVVLSDGFEAAYAKFGGDSDKDKEFIYQLTQDVSNGYVVNTPLMDYALELKKTYKLAMLSNVSRDGLKQFFEDGFLKRYFDPIVESAAIGYAKPEARAFETVADLLGVRCDECIMIDDRPDFCEGARAVGMQAIQYENLSQLQQDISKIL